MSKRKASYHHGDLRRALMDAALATVAEGGVASLSLREAARRGSPRRCARGSLGPATTPARG